MLFCYNECQNVKFWMLFKWWSKFVHLIFLNTFSLNLRDIQFKPLFTKNICSVLPLQSVLHIELSDVPACAYAYIVNNSSVFGCVWANVKNSWLWICHLPTHQSKYVIPWITIASSLTKVTTLIYWNYLILSSFNHVVQMVFVDLFSYNHVDCIDRSK